MRRRRAPRRRVPQIAVVGRGRCGPATARLARAVGREVAAAGAVLVCGGRGGVMAAAAEGAARAGGVVLGILPSTDPRSGNPWLSVRVPSGLGHARNVLVAAAGDALIALDGAAGTRSEVAFAQVLRRPVVALGAWGGVAGVEVARTPRDAVRRALARARR